MDDGIFKTLRRLFGEIEIETDMASFLIAGAPLGFHFSDAPMGGFHTQDRLPFFQEQRSDFAVRDWLKAHGIATSKDKAVWPVATIRRMLANRLYIGESEINRQNKGVFEATGFDTYRIVKAQFEPLVSNELFELARNSH
jgi:hypothetical protein